MNESRIFPIFLEYNHVCFIILVKSIAPSAAAPVTSAPAQAPASKSPSTSSAAPPLPTLTAPPPSTPAKPQREASKPTPTPAVAATAAAVATPTKPAELKPSADVKFTPAKPEPLPSTLIDLQRSVDQAAQLAVNEYNTAIQTLQRYTEDVKNVLDKIIESPDNSVWASLKNRTSARDSAVETAEKAAQQARATIGKLFKLISSSSHVTIDLQFSRKTRKSRGKCGERCRPRSAR